MGANLWLIAGLGNPGRRYQGTRHNIGFMIVEALADAESSVVFSSSTKFKAELARITLAGQPVLLAKPQTFMNLSGESIGALSRFYEIPSMRIIAVHDDVDLELGRIKLKQGGGDGGHKGIRSIAAHLSESDFFRVRCGVGRPEHGPGSDIADFVLDNFRAEERALLDEQIKRAGAAISMLMTAGLKEAMNNFHAPPEGKKKQKLDEGGSENHPRRIIDGDDK